MTSMPQFEGMLLIHQRLFVVDFALTPTLIADVPGMAWSGRLQEHRTPIQVIPGRRTLSEAFDSEAGPLRSRDAVVGQLTVILNPFRRLYQGLIGHRLSRVIFLLSRLIY